MFTKIYLFLLIVILSAIVASVTKLLHVNQTYEKDAKYLDHHKRWKNLTISDKPDHLMWFIQISDIHISIFHDESRITELIEFCERTVKVLQPSVVVATGDLTDAKTKDHIGSRQYEAEWKSYHSILKETKVNETTTWLDTRGNHDNFNVAALYSKENYFLNYSVQGPHHPRSYMHQFKKNGDIYSFIAVDACLDPGPRRPFNFIGLLEENEMEKLNHMADMAYESNGYVIWFGHFPTSCILSKDNGIRSVIAKHPDGLVYLCGHLHQLGGLVPKMYTLQTAGFLELELGDWKDNRMYRLAAVDHGLFSFVDIHHNEWPVILITNPKHALYVIPNREPHGSIVQSKHIRILAFSLADIVTVRVQINEEEWKTCLLSGGPLYTAEWNPRLYKTGIHTIKVFVKDSVGREKTIIQPFSMDNSQLSYGYLARLVLKSNVTFMFRSFFIVGVLICSLSLPMMRYCNFLIKMGRIRRPIVKNNCIHRWIGKLWALSVIDSLYWPLTIYPLYLCLGPWSVGYIIENYFGVIFVWGIFVNGAFLPGSFTYAYGFLQLIIFHIPLTLFLANYVNTRTQYQHSILKMRTLVSHIMFHLPFFIVVGIQLMLTYFFWLEYGTIAFLLGLLRTWSIVFAIYLLYQAKRVPEKSTKEIKMLWTYNCKTQTTLSSMEVRR